MYISVSSQTTLQNSANFFVFALYDASNPTVLLESQAPPKPYGDPIQISFLYTCLDGHIYIIKLWESADSTPTGIVRNSMSRSVDGFSINVRFDEYLEADVTTGLASGANTFEKADYENWDIEIERIGQGTMTPQSAPDISIPKYKRTNSDDSPNDLGPKITLLTSDDVFQPNENFVVRFLPQVVASNSGTPSSLFSTGRIIIADETLTTADIGKAIFIQSGTNKISVGLPLISTVSDYSFFYIYSNGGSHINAVIPAGGTDKYIYNGGDQSQLILGQSELLKVFKAPTGPAGASRWNVENDCFGIKYVGEIVHSYAQENNTLLCVGQTILRLEYPRLWEWVQQLELGVVVTDTAWLSTFVTVEGVDYYTKRGFFSSGDGSTTFRLPYLINFFIRGADGGGRMPGSFEVQTIQTHVHSVKPPSSIGVAGFGKCATGNEAEESTGIVPFDTLSYGSPETKPSNVAAYIRIRI